MRAMKGLPPMRAEIRCAVRMLGAGGRLAVPSVLAILKKYATRGQHVGACASDLTADETVEWYAGQGIDLLEREAWFAVNSWLNLVDKFVPVEAGET